jgi:hypothetical protein
VTRNESERSTPGAATGNHGGEGQAADATGGAHRVGLRLLADPAEGPAPPGAMDARDYDPDRIVSGLPTVLIDAWVPAAQAVGWIAARGKPSATARQMTEAQDDAEARLRAGELTAWRGNPENAAEPWEPVEARLFTLGMRLHPSGQLTRGDIPMEQYAALQNIQTGPVWCRKDDVLRIWPARVEIPAGFIALEDAVAVRIEFVAPGLLAGVQREDPEWLRMPAEDRAAALAKLPAPTPAEITKRAVLYDHEASIDLRTRDLRRDEQRRRLQDARQTAEEEIWAGLTTRRLPLAIAEPRGGTVDVPPEILDLNGRARVLGTGEVAWADGPVRYRGPAVITVQAFDRLRGLNAPCRCGTDRKREARWAARIAGFAEAQRQSRDWISLAEIADWCAREHGSIIPDPQRRDAAFVDLRAAIAKGAFATAGRSRVLFLHPTATFAKLTRERLAKIEACYPTTDVNVHYLGWCWVPRTLARDWFASLRLPAPPWLADAPAEAPRLVAAAPASARASKPRPVPQAKIENWYQLRVKSWPAATTPPSAIDDVTAAKEAHPDHTVTREVVRKLRQKFAPPPWTDHGRRKPAEKLAAEK